jgi:hypothetical protein
MNLNAKIFGNPIKIGIIGAGKIGINHARIFHTLGVNVNSIMCSTSKSANRAKRLLKTDYGISPFAFSNIDEILTSDIDAVSICTPPEFHYEHIISSFEKGLPVFCEKPIFWDNNCTAEYVTNKLNKIKNHPNRMIFTNTSNSELFKVVRKNLPNPEQINSFVFSFHTNGNYEKDDIAFDLMPHGFSVLLSCFGKKKIKSFTWESKNNNFQCDFIFGECHVKFDFLEHVNAQKKFVIKVNNRTYERIQKGHGKSYKVFMRDVNNGEEFLLDDPFKIFIKIFLDQINEPNRFDNFEISSTNLELMTFCLNKIKN